MYDHLIGEVCSSSPARLVVRAGGVGYEVKVPMSTSSALRVGQQAMLHTILHVVDGTPSLLGFRSVRERELARRLMTVTGVGPSIALAMLSTYGPAEIARAILDDEPSVLQRVKGVGTKTAERLCLELRDHIAKLDLLDGASAPASAANPNASDAQNSNDAIAALITLGYTEKEARAKLAKLGPSAAERSTEELIKAVLRS